MAIAQGTGVLKDHRPINPEINQDQRRTKEDKMTQFDTIILMLATIQLLLIVIAYQGTRR